MSDDVVLLGEQAERLLRDEVFNTAITRLEATYIQRWREAETRDTRESYHARISVLADLQTEIRKLVGNGQMESAQRKLRGRKGQ